MDYFLDKQRISLDESCKALNQYLLVQEDTDKRLTMIKNVFIKNIVYEIQDLNHHESFSGYINIKKHRISELESLIR